MNSKEIMPIPPVPELPEVWDYKQSIKKLGTKLYRWKQYTKQILDELWIAHEMLCTPGKRTDLITDEKGLPTWEQYCNDIGISQVTAWRWFKKCGWIEDKTERESKKKEIECPECGHTFYV